MHESSIKGLLGLATTGGAAIVACLPTVLVVVQIVAGCVAIVAGIFTIRYYNDKRKKLDAIYDP